MKIVIKLLKAALYLIIALAVWVGAGIGALYVNDGLDEKVALTKYTVTDSKIPEGFDGYKIMLISDLHEAPFSEQIIKHISEQRPDALVFTGDMAQLPEHSVEETLKIGEGAGDIPKYAVSGNHETQGGHYDEIMWTLPNAGIEPIDKDSAFLESGGDKVLLVGVKDPGEDIVSEEKIEKRRKEIEKELPDEDYYTILLNHRADLYPEFKDAGADLILSGHLHGGIIRLPFVGGLVGQHGMEEMFPEYEYGYIKEGDSAAMIVSGGCDRNPEKKRYFNPPEAVLITLERE